MDLPYILIFFLLCTLTIFIIFACLENKKGVLIFKTLSSILFIAIAISSYLISNSNSTYAGLIIAALCFSLLGDIMLVYAENKKCFITGILFFGIAQILYGIDFTIFSDIYVIDFVLLPVIIAVLIIIYNKLDMDVGDMKIPVLIYMFVITYMLVKAISFTYGTYISQVQTYLVVTGALLFYISDIILSIIKFSNKPVNLVKILGGLNLITYYSGQVLIALSILYAYC